LRGVGVAAGGGQRFRSHLVGQHALQERRHRGEPIRAGQAGFESTEVREVVHGVRFLLKGTRQASSFGRLVRFPVKDVAG